MLAFGFVASLSVAGLGYLVREDRRESETKRFSDEVESACARVVAEIERQAESDRKLVGGACQSGELVDRALLWFEAGTLDDERRLALSRIVPEERQAFDFDELLLATGDGQLIGQDPIALLKMQRTDVAKLLSGDPSRFALRASPDAAIVSRCRRSDTAGHAVGLVGARHLTPVVDRLGKTIDARISIGAAPPSKEDVARASCNIKDANGAAVPLVVVKSKRELVDNLARIDQTVIYVALAWTGVALLVGIVFARSIGKPIAELAAEARKVASGEARPTRVGGSGEIAELSAAFDKMLDDLVVTRRRLAATSRVAAWREVARRVAHEVKNPLAPIRAAVETLRRLRARGDAEFDAYFDEATRTVLDEVMRISNIVTEFTRFARLPPPNPSELDVMDVARQVARLHEASTKARIEVKAERVPPVVRADRDQVVQLLTNLVQNAIDAVADKGEGGLVRVVLSSNEDHAIVTVSDNGPGVAPEIAPRLFEPYATTKERGTGLGLAIAQRIAIEHNGELSYVGKPGEGARFRLALPVEGPQSDRLSNGSSAQAPRDGSR